MEDLVGGGLGSGLTQWSAVGGTWNHVAMTSYFARYEAGERDQVWQELRAMGSTAVDGRCREDAQAVAHSMALRARHNVDLLVSRLSEAGFVFRSNDSDLLDRPPHTPPSRNAPELVAWMERGIGPVPLTLAAWIREVGDVWLIGDHPDWPESDLADPLVIELECSGHQGFDARSYLEGEFSRWCGDHSEGEVFQVYFAPDDLHKADISGGGPYGISLPFPAVDAWCETPSGYFVDYLNEAFAAGGFPGALASEGYKEPPPGLRENLAKDLLRL